MKVQNTNVSYTIGKNGFQDLTVLNPPTLGMNRIQELILLEPRYEKIGFAKCEQQRRRSAPLFFAV